MEYKELVLPPLFGHLNRRTGWILNQIPVILRPNVMFVLSTVIISKFYTIGEVHGINNCAINPKQIHLYTKTISFRKIRFRLLICFFLMLICLSIGVPVIYLMISSLSQGNKLSNNLHEILKQFKYFFRYYNGKQPKEMLSEFKNAVRKFLRK